MTRPTPALDRREMIGLGAAAVTVAAAAPLCAAPATRPFLWGADSAGPCIVDHCREQGLAPDVTFRRTVKPSAKRRGAIARDGGVPTR